MEDVKYNFNKNDVFVRIDRVKDRGGYIFNVTLNFFKEIKIAMVILPTAIIK